MLIHLALFILIVLALTTHSKLGFLKRRMCYFMATLQEVNDKLDAVATGVDALEDAIAALKAEVAAGHVITAAELDALGEKASAIVDDIADTSDQG